MSDVDNGNFQGKIDHSLSQNNSFMGKVDHLFYQNASFQGKINHGLGWVWWISSFKGKVNHGVLDKFQSLRGVNPPDYDEKNAKFVVDIYICCPELGTEVKVDYKDISGLKITRGMNKPIMADFALDNTLKTYTKTTGDLAGLFSRGLYSTTRETRKFLKFIVRAFSGSGELWLTQYFPRMVISNKTGGKFLNITCIDEISYYLTQEVTMRTFVSKENLSRDPEDSTKFYGIYISSGYNRFGNSELRVNCEQTNEGFTCAKNEDDIWQFDFDEEVEEHFSVEFVAPNSIYNIMKSVCWQPVTQLPSAIKKEYFDIQCNFDNWQTRFDFPVPKSTPISIIEPLIKCIPGEYFIKPGQEKLSLVIQKTVTVDKYPDVGKYTFSPANSRGKIGVSYGVSTPYNKINIQKPAETGTAYREVSVTT